MHFPLRHSGLRFFFLTLATERRRPVLSLLVRDAARPGETETGACVASVWRSLHAADPALTASDRVLMPDHEHLLLLVRGEVEFNPLVFARWFMEATEDAAAGLPWSVPSGPSRWIAPSPRGGHEGPPRLWSRETYVEISFDPPQLRAIRRYIRLNPARWWWKHDHPDRFALLRPLRHPRLPPGSPWSVMGDATLLSSPFLFPVRLSRSAPPGTPAGETAIAAAVDKAQRGWIPLCGFLSAAEREFARRLKQLPRTRWIKTVPYGLPARCDPAVEDSRWLSSGRELLLSALDPASHPPWKTTRDGCQTMNALNAALCAGMGMPSTEMRPSAGTTTWS